MKKWNSIYARQSKDKKDSLSMEGQVDICLPLVPPGEDVKVYDEDKGFSGKNTLRPSLEELIKDIKADCVKRVIVYKLDRLSRNIVDFYKIWEIMQEHECSFISVKENFDTSTVMGRAMMGLLAVFAQMERESIQQRVTDNYYYRITYGTWPGGPAPFGFNNGVTEEGKKTLCEITDQKKYIIQAFNMYAYNANISLAKIGVFFEKNGIKGKKRDTFDNVTIARMFQNPVYAIADKKLYKYYQIRKIKFASPFENWNGTTSAHIVGKKKGNTNIGKYESLEKLTIYLTNFKGFVDSTTFIKVQERLRENEQIGRANSLSRMEELAGLVKCAKCGYAVKMNSYPYLSCYGRFGLRLCDVKFTGVKFTDIQYLVGQEVQKVLDNLQEINNQKHANITKKEQEIDRLKTEIKNLITLTASGNIIAEAVKDELENRQKKIYELELEIQMIGEVKLNDSSLNYFTLDTEKKKAVVRQLIEKINLSGNGDIEIIWKI